MQDGVLFLERARGEGLGDFEIALEWINFQESTYKSLFFSDRKYVEETQLMAPENMFCYPNTLIINNVLEELILTLSDENMVRLFNEHVNAKYRYGTKQWHLGALQAIVARQRPALMHDYIKAEGMTKDAVDWRYLAGATEAFDEACLKSCQKNGDIESLIILDLLRKGKYSELVTELCINSRYENWSRPLAYLAQKNPISMLRLFVECIELGKYQNVTRSWKKHYCQVAVEHWTQGGAEVFACIEIPQLFAHENQGASKKGGKGSFLDPLVRAATGKALEYEEVGQWLTKVLRESPEPKAGDSLSRPMWQHVVETVPSFVESDLWEKLQHKRKYIRQFAVTGLTHESISGSFERAVELLSAKKVDARLGAVELLAAIGDDRSVVALTASLDIKHPEKVRGVIIKTLEQLGQIQTIDKTNSAKTLADVIFAIEQQKPAKLPKSINWLDVSSLPALLAKDGSMLSENVILQLMVTQAKHKTINPALDNIDLLSHIDREKSGDFAIALLNQWLSSRQQASDRWTLTLAGLLGDQRILAALTNPIKGWAEASRHKLAEYAAQAISLVPVDESLMILDTLANRYRSRFVNIGKVCRTALEQAAQSQGVSMEELADRIVPTLNFNSEYQRELPGTKVLAVLQPDFKIAFYNPETDSETKSPPSSLPEIAIEDIKTLRKLIREILKGQTARLEQAMVRQRTWSVTRWRELFETNPFLKSYASRLVWASLDEGGEPIRLFRRYPNGLLADAKGELIEFDHTDHSVVMVHPLNMDETTLEDWTAHLSRSKIKPPFIQLERSTARLDPAHGNRKILSLTDKHQMACGTFRTRAERLGWVRGSVVDAGGISSYYKSYPGARVTAFLLIDFMYVGQNPTENVELSIGLFVKEYSVKVGSYVYDEPANTDDPRVMAFKDVHPVAYSETLSDLQAITAET